MPSFERRALVPVLVPAQLQAPFTSSERSGKALADQDCDGIAYWVQCQPGMHTQLGLLFNVLAYGSLGSPVQHQAVSSVLI